MSAGVVLLPDWNIATWLLLASELFWIVRATPELSITVKSPVTVVLPASNVELPMSIFPKPDEIEPLLKFQLLLMKR